MSEHILLTLPLRTEEFSENDLNYSVKTVQSAHISNMYS